jgi:5-methylcytosine-specific restriction endonuclease McrA
MDSRTQTDLAFTVSAHAVKRNETRRRRFRRIISANEPPCAICGHPIDYQAHHLEPNSFQIDHITPLDRGGDDVLENIQAACRKCNRAKSNKVAPKVDFVTERDWA